MCVRVSKYFFTFQAYCLTFLNLVLGIQIIFTLDEVAFIQNLVFYIEKAYSITVSTIYICI